MRCAGRSDKSGYWDAVPGGRPQPWMPGNRLTLIRGNSKAIPTVHPLWQADFRNAVWNTALLPGLGLWIYFLFFYFIFFTILCFELPTGFTGPRGVLVGLRGLNPSTPLALPGLSGLQTCPAHVG